MLPGTDRVGPIVILGGVEKMVNIAIPYFWIVIFCIISFTKFKWANR
jgi:hypothetical protein